MNYSFMIISYIIYIFKISKILPILVDKELDTRKIESHFIYDNIVNHIHGPIFIYDCRHNSHRSPKRSWDDDICQTKSHKVKEKRSPSQPLPLQCSCSLLMVSQLKHLPLNIFPQSKKTSHFYYSSPPPSPNVHQRKLHADHYKPFVCSTRLRPLDMPSR